MRRALSLLGVILLVGCTQTEDTPKVDPATAKSQPGADTPPSTMQGAPMSQQRAEKAGG